MGNTSTLPVVSQLKSGVQLITGDVDGALETQEKFFHECPIVAQVTSVAELIVDGDEKKFEQTNARSGKLILNTLDGIPVVGHAKAGIHLIAGDDAGAAQAFNSANRSSGVIAGGVGGFLVGGPVGAVAGGIAGGAAADGIKTGIDSAIHDEYRPSGSLAALQNAIDNPSGGAIFDAVAVPVFDGVAGYGAGQITAKVQAGLTKAQLAKTVAQRDTAQALLDEGIFDGKMTSGEANTAAQGVNQMTAKITALEGKLGAPEVFVDPKTGITHNIKSQGAIPKTTPAQCATAGAAAADRTEIENLLTDMEMGMVQKMAVDNAQLKRLITLIVDQLAPAAYEQVVLEIIKSETNSTQSASQLRKKVKRITQQVRKYLRVRKGEAADDSDSGSSDDEDGELNCVHWNICGLSAQLKSALGFVWVIVARRPDVILLNEMKANNQTLADLTTLLGYKYVSLSSSTGLNNRPIRGSAILYRAKSKKFTFRGGDSRGYLENNGVTEVETTWADFKLKSGDTYRLVSCYVLKDSERHFATAAKALKDISSGQRTIVAGDLNMRKGKFLSRWKDEGFIDCLRERWITNVQGSSATAIDYVMTSNSNLRHVVAHKPVRPAGTNLHLLVPFSVGPNLDDYQWCENTFCFYRCTI